MNLVELALATNIPKGCAETAVRGRARDTNGVVRGGVMGWLVDGAGPGGVGGCCSHRQNPRLTQPSALVLVHVSYLDGKGNLAPQGSGKGL